jgi:hypothetical protein
LILALDTAFATVVSTDRLDAMRRSAMARFLELGPFGGLLKTV